MISPRWIYAVLRCSKADHSEDVAALRPVDFSSAALDWEGIDINPPKTNTAGSIVAALANRERLGRLGVSGCKVRAAEAEHFSTTRPGCRLTATVLAP
ncbi:MAG: hypothetical protein ABIZ80_03205 [Bryobacteraceae bacterium]